MTENLSEILAPVEAPLDPALDPKLAGATALNAALSDELGVEVRQLDPQWARYASEGVVVDLTLRRERFKIQLTLRHLGIEPANPEEARQLNSIVQPGHRFLLPREMAVAKPDKIDSDARECLKKHAFKTFWGSWIHVSRYAAWSEANAVIKARYDAVVDEIEERYEDLRRDAIAGWVGLCNRAYDQLLRTASPEVRRRIPEFAERDRWLQAQVALFASEIPSMATIRAKFVYEWKVYSLPLQRQIEVDQLAADRIRLSAAQELMLEDMRRTAKEKVSGGVAQLLAEVQGQIQREVLAVTANALKTVQGRGGKLERNSSKALGDLIKASRDLMFWDDATLTSRFAALEALLQKDPKKREPAETTALLRTLGAEARLALLNLGQPVSREAAIVDGQEIPTTEAGRDLQRTLAVVGFDVDEDELVEIARRSAAPFDEALFDGDDDGVAATATRSGAEATDLFGDDDDDELAEAGLGRQAVSV